MKPETLRKVISIGDEILECKLCSLHKALADKGIPYRPDAPIGYKEESRDFKVMSVGINPGWDDNFYQQYLKAIYREPDLKKSRVAVEENWKEKKEENQIGRQPYRYGVYSTFDIINHELGIYKENIEEAKIFDYVFWTNLSFCGSQKPFERVFDGQKVPSNVIQEEVPTCLGQGYLKRLIEALDPELVMFFGLPAVNLFPQIFDVASYDKEVEYIRKFVAHKKAGKDIYTSIFSRKLRTRGKETRLIFLPHPRYPLIPENKTEALRDVCKWFLQASPSPDQQTR